ncbi:MAG: hypothetical protein FIB02_11055 [Desulfuromonas sp.]|nr:hypothetical protein [Desulfuromonas sp.]
MWNKWRGRLLAGAALTVYVVGGLGVMAGLVLIGIVGDRDLWGWGQANSIGYLCFGVGLCFTILGVLVMRIMRNRHIA